MFTKLLLPILTYLIVFGHGINVAGQDTIPPTITIDEEQLIANYGYPFFDYHDPPWEPQWEANWTNITENMLQVTLSCTYSFPEDYYFKIENATIEDDSGIFSDTIIVDTIIYNDDNPYGTVIQTIIAEDNSGNTSKFTIISTIGYIYSPEFSYLSVGDYVVYDRLIGQTEFGGSLEQTDFEFCEGSTFQVNIGFDNYCSTGGNIKFDWYKNGTLVPNNSSESITIDMSNETDITELKVIPRFDKIIFSDIKLNIYKTTNESVLKITNPTCWNDANGSIKFDLNVSGVTLEHNGTNVSFEPKYNNLGELYIDALDTGTYYISYMYSSENNYGHIDVNGGCEYNDTITLAPSGSSGIQPPFQFDYGTVDGTVVLDPDNLSTNIEFEFCKDSKFDIELFTSNNSCTGNTKIDWFKKYKNNTIPVLTDSNTITVDLSNETEDFVLIADARFTNTYYKNIEINFQKNILDFTISDTIIDLSQNELLTITNNSNTTGDFLWQIGDSSFVNNTNEFDCVFKSPGNYKIKLINEGDNCNDTISKNIVVESTTSVQINSFSNIKIGPNPFINFLNVDLGKSSDYKITLYGIDGIAYFIDQFRDIRNMEVNLNFLTPGVYVLKIASLENTELIESFKIVKFDL